MLDFKHVNPLRAFIKKRKLAYYYFILGFSRAVYLKLFKKKNRPKRYSGSKVLDIKKSNEILRIKILENKPFMAARFGSNELRIMFEYLFYHHNIVKSVHLNRLKPAFDHSGVYPVSIDAMKDFTNIMISSISQCDLLGVWYNLMEDYFARYYLKTSILTHRKIFDFWNHKEPFTYALKNKKVLVVSPFTETIRSQYKRRDKIFENSLILPEFELLTFKSIQSIGGEHKGHENWKAAFLYMRNKIREIDFDIAILGCGAYGFPLAADIKKSGKMALHFGGVTQMLFGIKGKRWDDDSIASELYNKYWVRPKIEETPQSSKDVEGGCYW